MGLVAATIPCFIRAVAADIQAVKLYNLKLTAELNKKGRIEDKTSMNTILRILIIGGLVLLLSYFLPGVAVSSFLTALLVAAVLALLNALLRPILVILTIPITILTLGLFLLVINALMVLLVDALVPGFEVAGFLQALIFSILLSLLTWVLDRALV
ncbi:membrane protein [Flammeovirgaceae bacterium 311]|nr:membrane protein [Flammeovirgaceae bacterium 311]